MPQVDAGRAGLALAAIDLLGCLFLVLLVLVQPQLKAPPRIETDGQYAVTIQWPAGSEDDVDLYVQDPESKVCYFAADHIGLMNLENDDLGAVSDTQGTVRLLTNHERTIIRGALPGEYVVNVQMYDRKRGTSPEPILVRLWRLKGDDKLIRTATVFLRGNGSERTAFRFRLSAGGEVVGYSSLPKSLVDSANEQATGLSTSGGTTSSWSQPPVNHDLSSGLGGRP